MANFKLDVDADGIALITWDMPDRPMNVITLDAIEELSGSRVRSSPPARKPSAAAPT